MVIGLIIGLRITVDQQRPEEKGGAAVRRSGQVKTTTRAKKCRMFVETARQAIGTRMPTLEEVVEKFETSWMNGARVQVNWEGLAAATAGQNLITAQVHGRVLSVHPEGERTLVYVGQLGQNNSVIRMYLSAECIFESLPHPGNEEAFANLESRIRIAFPNGEHCFVHFFHAPT